MNSKREEYTRTTTINRSYSTRSVRIPCILEHGRGFTIPNGFAAASVWRARTLSSGILVRLTATVDFVIEVRCVLRSARNYGRIVKRDLARHRNPYEKKLYESRDRRTVSAALG